MLHIIEISKMPTTRDEGNGKVHESVFRSWNILRTVKRLLEMGAPPALVLELIADMEDGRK
jgi:hypothetical protein